MDKLEFANYILDAFPDYVYVIDMETYGVVYINKALETLLGNPSEEVWRSTPCYKLLQDNDTPCEFCNNPILKDDKSSFWTRYNPLFKSWITYKDDKINHNGKNYRLEIARDITESVETNEMLTDLLQEKRILVECISLLESQEDLEASMTKMLKLIADYHDAERANIYEFDDTTRIATYTHEYRKDNVQEHLSMFNKIEFAYLKPFMAAFNKGMPFRVIDRETDPVIQKDPICNIQLLRHNLNSLIVVPVISHEGRIVALLSVDNPKQRIYAQSIIQPISSFFLDCLEKQKTIEKLYKLSFTDGLTGMKNSHAFLEAVKELEAAPPKSCGIAYVDINGLKTVNDTEGHDAGNLLILSCAKVLKEIFDQNAYRTGGDEFIVVVPNCNENDFIQNLALIKEKAKFEKDLKVAIGHSWTNITTNGLSKYIQEADAAMYLDKKAFYTSTGLDRRHN